MADKTRFTPGPWVVCPADDYCIVADAYPKKFLGRFKGDDTGTFLALVGNRTEDQGEANARLIAAAPEMYEALKWFVEATTHWDDTGGRIAIAKNALAKAVPNA